MTEENVYMVDEYFTDNPRASIRQASSSLRLSYYAVHKILKNKLKFKAYKITFSKPLSDRGKLQRVEFANKLLALCDSEEIDFKRIIFSDEAHFWLNEFVNKQNYRIFFRHESYWILESFLTVSEIEGILIHLFSLQTRVYFRFLNLVFFLTGATY
jgi:hypothetical protein